MPRGRPLAPAGMSERQADLWGKRQKKMTTLGETLRDEHRKLHEGRSSDPTDRAKFLLGYADIAQLVYSGWEQGELTPLEFASPAMYRAVFKANPDLAARARDSIIDSIKSGEIGEPLKFMELLAKMGNPDGHDQSSLTGDEELLLGLRAKYTLGAAVARITKVARDLRIALSALNIIDAGNRQNYADIPWRAEVMGVLVEEWAPEMSDYDASLRANWVAVAERMADALAVFETLMIGLYTRAMADYVERGPRRDIYP